MAKLVVELELDSFQLAGLEADRIQNLFSTNEEFAGVRLLELINAMTQVHIFDPEEKAAVEAVREARKKPALEASIPPPSPTVRRRSNK